MYDNAPLTYPDKLSPEVSTPYIKLALVKGAKVSNLKDANEFTRLTLEGDLDLIFQHKEEISMDKVFTLDSDSKLRLVIVEGAPGIGKSTFVLELCRQWPKMLSLQPFSLVVLLKLRDEEIRLAKGVGDLLPWEDHPTDHATLVEEVTKREGEGVLILFDGFDEFPAHLRQSPSTSYVMKVLHGKALPRATVLVTSRPSARIHLQPLMRSNSTKLIEVVGFGEEQIQQFAANVFGPESETLASFNDYLHVNPVIRSMMYNPLNCSIITEFFGETSRSKKPVPHTQTQLYTEMALWRLSRYLSGVGDPLATDLPDNLSDIPNDSPLYKKLVEIGKLALEGQENETIIFERIPENCSDLGLLIEHQALYRRKKSTTYNFFHLTMQEYMSAFYIAQLPATDQKMLFEQYQSMPVVWRFVAGLTKMDKIGWDVVCDSSVIPLLCQCVYEAQDTDRVKALFTSRNICLPESVRNYDAFVLGYCISGFSNTWSFDVDGMHDEDLKMLCHGVKSVQYGGGTIERFECYECFGILNNKNYLLTLPHDILRNMKTLKFLFCEIDQNGWRNIAECIPHTPSLTTLELVGNPGVPGGIPRLMQALREHKEPLSLRLIGMTLEKSDVTALLDLLQITTSCIKTLTLNMKDVTSSVHSVLQEILALSLSLENLHLEGFPVEAVVALCAINENIRGLNIYLSGVGVPTIRANDIRKLCQFISENKSLQQLTLRGVLYEELSAISQSLQQNHTLREVTLSIKRRIEHDCDRLSLDPRITLVAP